MSNIFDWRDAQSFLVFSYIADLISAVKKKQAIDDPKIVEKALLEQSQTNLDTAATLQTVAPGLPGSPPGTEFMAGKSWQIVWGPVPHTFETQWLNPFTGEPIHDTGITNNMFVAKSAEDPPRYAVAVAGTDFHSLYGWLGEDFSNNRTVPWTTGNAPSWTPSAALSEGAHRGLSILQGLKPSVPLPNVGVSMLDFLQAETTTRGAGLDIVVTGHSLGGALAPTVATWLNDTIGSQSAASRPANIVTYAYAGPTPGNAGFALYVDQTLPDRVFRVLNPLDIAHLVWGLGEVHAVPWLYQRYGIDATSPVVDASGPCSRFFDSFIPSAEQAVKLITTDLILAGQIQYLHSGIPHYFPGTFYEASTSFLSQAVAQHVQGYPDGLLIPAENPQGQAWQDTSCLERWE